MGPRDAIARLERAGRRRFDDGTLDLAAGLVLFGLGASLDLGRPQLLVVAYAALVAFGARFLFVWPRVGYAIPSSRARAEPLVVFGGLLALALTVVLLLGVQRTTGFEPEAAGVDRIRLVAAATIWALAGLLAWSASRRGTSRHAGFAAAIVASYLLGPLVDPDARAWALALLGIAFGAVGALRLKALSTAFRPSAGDEPDGV